MSTRLIAAILVATLLACPVAYGQDRASLWRSYAETLPRHMLVVVRLKSGKSMQGHVIQVTGDRIVVLRKTRIPVPPSDLALDDVESIEPRKNGWSPGLKVLVGVGSTFAALLPLALIAALSD